MSRLPYPVLLVISLCLSYFDQAPTERGGANLHNNAWPLEALLALFSLSPFVPLPSVSLSNFELSLSSRIPLSATLFSLTVLISHRHHEAV